MIEIKTQTPTENQLLALDSFRKQYNNMALYLQSSLPTSRELSLALTKIEEASMWTSKAILNK